MKALCILFCCLTLWAQDIPIGRTAFPDCNRMQGPGPLRDGNSYRYYKDDRLLGYEAYGITGKIFEQRTYRDNVLNGFLYKWDESGTLISSVEYESGRRNGEWTEWSLDGRLVGKSIFVQGTGTRTRYYLNGKVEIIEEYADSLAHGRHNTYYENGNLESMIRFHSGKRVGVSFSLHKDGNVWNWNQYNEHGRIDGLIFHKSEGQELECKIYSDGASLWESSSGLIPPDDWKDKVANISNLYQALVPSEQ